MSVQVNVSINFEAEDRAAAQAAIDGLSGLPEGAIVGGHVNEPLALGRVNAEGAIESQPLTPAPQEEEAT